MPFRVQTLMQETRFDFPPQAATVGPTGQRRDWQPGRVIWDEDRTVKSEPAGKGLLTRWRNETTDAGYVPVGEPTTDQYGFTVHILRSQSGQSRMFRQRVQPVD